MSQTPSSPKAINLTVTQFFKRTRSRKFLRNLIIIGIILAYPLYFVCAYIIIYYTPFPSIMQQQVIADINGSQTVYSLPSGWHIASAHKVPFIFPINVYSDEGNTIDEEWCITISPPLNYNAPPTTPISHESVSEFIWVAISSPPSTEKNWYLMDKPCVFNGRIPDSGG